MLPDVLDEAQRLRAKHAPFVLATVVVAQHPTSGTLGARAVVLPDGTICGWLGGSCVQPVVRRQSLQALADGSPRLVILSPEVAASDSPKPGVVRVPMTCASQGELQVYVEPFLPKVELVVIGASPVATTLARLGGLLGFDVCSCGPEADTEAITEVGRTVQSLTELLPTLTSRSYVVVATMGSYDEEALGAALQSPASYVGLIASLRRLAAVLETLRQRGLGDDLIARVKRPEGIAANTLVPAEIAFSAMAELLEVRRQGTGVWAVQGAPPAEAIDPICGMAVDIASARYTSERDGQTYYFCAAGCKAAFDAA